MRFDVYMPRNERQLLAFIARRKKNVTVVAGGTDVLPATRLDGTTPKCLVDISHLEELRHITLEGDTVRVGALTKISDFKTQKVVENNYEAFRQVADGFGGPSIANMATVGGNICAASSSADLLPVLFAVDASLVLRSLRGERTVRVKDFLLKHGKTRLRAEEIVAEVRFEAPKRGMFCLFRKIGRRSSFFMATVSASTFIDLDLETLEVKRARVAFNSLRGGVPGRAELVESALIGKNLKRKVIEKAASMVGKEFTAASDSQAKYKVEAAAALLKEQLHHIKDEASGG